LELLVESIVTFQVVPAKLVFVSSVPEAPP
jgi:hypothetical protein